MRLAENVIFSGFSSKLTRTKTQQITEKPSKHNVRTVFLRILICGGVNFFFKYFILSSFYFLNIVSNVPFLLVPWSEILMSSSRSQSCVCSSGWNTVSAANTTSDTSGRGPFICPPFPGNRQRGRQASIDVP